MLRLFYILTGCLKLSTRAIDFLIFLLTDSGSRRSFPIEVINLRNCSPDLNWVRGVIAMACKNRFLILGAPISVPGSKIFQQRNNLFFLPACPCPGNLLAGVMASDNFLTNLRFQTNPISIRKDPPAWVKSTPLDHPPPWPQAQKRLNHRPQDF